MSCQHGNSINACDIFAEIEDARKQGFISAGIEFSDVRQQAYERIADLCLYGVIERDRLKAINAELMAALELSFSGIVCAVELAKRCEDETFIAFVLTQEKIAESIARAKSPE